MKQSAQDWAGVTVVPGEGDGTLARVGPVVLLVGSTDPEVVRPYLEHVEMVAANGGQGRQLVRGFALMLSTSVDESPGFAAIAPHSTGLAVFIDGDVTVTVDDEQISGADSLAWVERLIPWPVDSISLGLPGATPADPAAAYRLDGGVVRAASVAVPAGAPGAAPDLPARPLETGMAAGGHSTVDVPGEGEEAEQAEEPDTREESAATSEMASDMDSAATGESDAPVAAAPVAVPDPEAPAPPAAPAAPAPPPPTGGGRPLPPQPKDENVQFQSVLLDDLDDDDFEPLPLVDDASVVVDDSHPHEEVRGVYCKNRHFNDPRQLFCGVCGINMVQQTPVLVSGPRPPLGVVVMDDGSVFQLDTPYLLGRDPGADERVRGGSFRGLPVIDQSHQVSRVHARLELRGWDVVLIDNNSTNGTFVHVPRTPDWQRLPSGGEHILAQGTRIRIGHRTLAFNTHAGS